MPEVKDLKLDAILIKGDGAFSTSDLQEVFTGRENDVKKLRKDAWKRR